MSQIVEFQLLESPKSSVELQSPQLPSHHEVKVSAKSIVSRDLFVRVSVSAQDKPQSTWFSVPPELGRVKLEAGKELPSPVTVTVEIPPNTPFDKYGFKVLVADDAAPEIDFSESPLITVERKQKVVKPFPWKWVAIGVGGAAVVAIAVVWWLYRPTALGAECRPGFSRCAAGGACPRGLERCAARSRRRMRWQRAVSLEQMRGQEMCASASGGRLLQEKQRL